MGTTSGWQRALHTVKLYLGLGEDSDYEALDRKYGLDGVGYALDPERERWSQRLGSMGALLAIVVAFVAFDRWWVQLLAAITLAVAVQVLVSALTWRRYRQQNEQRS